MPQSDAVDMNQPSADHSGARRRFGVLIDQVTASVAEISAASSVLDTLPATLAGLAGALRFDRVTITEAMPQNSAASHRLLFQWTATDCPAPPLEAAALFPSAEIEALKEWAEPLRRGEPGISLRSRAPAPLSRLLSDRGVYSARPVPVVVEGRSWGQIGFDDCRSEHEWSVEDSKLVGV